MKLPKNRSYKTDGGFTLIELLLVIVIISTLAVGVFVALNPGQRLRDSKDARRTADVETILSGVHQYIIDNRGAFPAGLTSPLSEVQLGTAATGCAISTGGCAAVGTACLNLQQSLTSYLKQMPSDPNATLSGGTAATTGYTITVDASGIITVRACRVEGTNNILQAR